MKTLLEPFKEILGEVMDEGSFYENMKWLLMGYCWVLATLVWIPLVLPIAYMIKFKRWLSV